MNLPGITFTGPAFTETSCLPELPIEYRDLLSQTNGFIAFDGGFHFRGICDAPVWHSLFEAWRGASSLHHLFPAVLDSDLPFGQDCMGDQFLLRDGVVHKLSAEAGEVASMELSLREFLAHLTGDPFEFLQLHPLAQFQLEGGQLRPGQLLAEYPPFITKEAANEVSLRAISAGERISFLAALAMQLSSLADGKQFRISGTD